MRVSSSIVPVAMVLSDLGVRMEVVVHDNIICHCPWPENHTNADVHPSFSVNAETGRWLCFRGCGQGGGQLEKLVMMLKKLNISDAKHWLLARGAEDDLRDILVDPMAVEKDEQLALDWVQTDYAQQIESRTSSYILERGFTWSTLRSWGVRYDTKLRAIVIPVYDEGELVGLIRRFVPPIPVNAPKYLYSPGFVKSNVLFGFDKHDKKGATIIVEGPLDCMWLHQAGYRNVVALLGVSCSKVQERLLTRLGSKIIMAYDNDAAGIEAARKLHDQLCEKFTVFACTLPDGVKDVQELDNEGLEEVFGRAKYEWE